MAKVKKAAAKQAAGQGGGAGPAGSKVQLQLFPTKPPRPPNQRPPGRPVDLITNLFMMSVKQNKPIHRYGVNIEFEDDEAKEGSSKASGDGAQPRVKKALKNQEIRRNALDQAMRTWIKNNKPEKYDQRLVYNYIFDANGSTVYTLFSMPNNPDHAFRVKLNLEAIIEGKLSTEERYLRVTLSKGEEINLRVLLDYCMSRTQSDMSLIQEHIRAVNVIMRGKICTLSNMVLTPTNVYPFTGQNQFKISEGVKIVKGYSMSARPSECGLVLNVANSFGAFHEEVNLIDLLSKRFFVRDLTKALSQDVIEKLKREICTKQIEATHINYGTQKKPHFRKYRVGDICGNSEEKFTLVDKATKTTSQITIKDYFKKEYGITIKFPKLPCIVDRGRKLPLEVCHLIDKQRVVRKMDPEETAAIIKHAAVRPEIHFNQINESVKMIKDESRPIQDFGLDFDTKPIEVTGRELEPIGLVDGTGKGIAPRGGQYMGNRFFKPATVNKWVITFLVDRFVKMDLDRGQQNRLSEQRFSQLYVQGGIAKGVMVDRMVNPAADCIFLDKPDPEIKAMLKRYFNHLNKSKIDHAIIVLPRNCPEWMYRYLQYLEVSCGEGRGENERWTRTSCIKYENYQRKIVNDRDNGRMFISNLWLKYNTKLGGINYVLKNDNRFSFLQDGFIFISIDVCHPAPGDKLSQSVAAVVGMWDLTNINMSFCTRIRVQKKQRADHSTIEEVGEVGAMVDEVLGAYSMRKKKLPSKIVIIRDGVSEGQYKMVLQNELGRVKSAMQNKYANQKQNVAPLTCMVVQKRHKVRFMRKVAVTTPRGPDFNIQPGTVVDSKITHPTDFSFYLAPHKAIQGTSKAAHIYMICDENKFSQDEAQAMVHALSYLSPRCTKSTSIPTPVNLADLAAEQGKNLVVSWADDRANQRMSEDEKITKVNEFLAKMADSNYKNTLYYV